MAGKRVSNGDFEEEVEMIDHLEMLPVIRGEKRQGSRIGDEGALRGHEWANRKLSSANMFYRCFISKDCSLRCLIGR